MASFGRTRRAQNGFVRSFAVLVVVSLLLLFLRNSDPVKGASTAATQLLVPIQRVLADAGITSNRFVQAITEIETTTSTANDRTKPFCARRVRPNEAIAST